MSYTTHIPAYASTSGSTSSSNSRKHSSSRKATSADTAADDKADLKSIASGHSACSTRTQLSSRSNTLKLAIRTDDLAVSARPKSKSSTPSKHRTAPQKLVVRRARCPPEFLEEIARSGAPHGLQTRAESTFKVVNGLEAEALFDHFVGRQASADLEKSITVKGDPHSSGPLVFAITLLDTGRRVVDYYMTWRGKLPRVRDHGERQLSFLDSEFRRVARSLDNHYKTIISIVDNASSVSAPVRKQDMPSRPETPPPEPPPKDDRPRSPDAESATSSVISLPLLNMMRNVPFGNRQMLRVTNPDTASILSAEDAPASASRALDTIAEGVEASTASPLRQSPTSVVAGSPSHADRRNRDRRPKDSSLKHSTSVSKSLDRTKKRAHTDDNHSKRIHKHKRDVEGSNKHNPKKRHHDTHSRRKHDSDTDSDKASEFTIVLLDDNGEKDLLSWHGLNRIHVNNAPRSSSSSLLTNNDVQGFGRRDSPWTGPLVNANRLIFHTGPRSGPSPAGDYSEDESDNDDSDDSDDRYYHSYEATVVIPQAVTPAPHQYLSPAPSAPVALSYAGSASSYRSNSSGSSGSSSLTGRAGERPISRASSAVSYRTAYTYPTHRSSIASSASSASSYVPAWINPRHYVIPDTPPLTGIQTPVSYLPY
ncbi:hypothetical protein JOM56_006791 [Amanita muscaria]